MPAVSKTYAHEKPFGGRLAEAEPRIIGRRPKSSGKNWLCAPGEPRYRGRSTPGKKGGPKRDGPDDQPWMVQAAGASPISAGHEMETRGTGIYAWARISKEGG